VETRRPEVDAFGGMTGQVLEGAMSVGTMLTGSLLLLVFGTLGFIMVRFGADDGFTIFLQLGITFGLVRFALNSYAGEWRGTILSTHGGTWWDVGVVSLRYLALSSVWLIPALIVGWKPQELLGAFTGSMGSGGSRVLGLTTMMAALSMLTPRVFLIVSVGAGRFSDLIDREHWAFLFRGRMQDLYLVYVIYLGGLAMVAALTLPLITASMFQSPELGTFIGILALAYALGLAVTLLGRLCGSFAGRGRTTDEWDFPAIEPESDSNTVEEPRTSEDTGMPETPPAAAAVRAVRPADPAPVAPAAERASTLNPSGKTPLLDARPRVDELEHRFREDPEAALEGIEELNRVYAPHPLVLHMLCVMQHRSGKTDASLDTAREALPLCLERGATSLAAQIFGMHLDRADAFDLPRDTILVLAEDLRKAGDLEAAEATYLGILDRDRGERRAVKGLLQIAEAYLQITDYDRARDLYQLLLHRCPDSPFAVHMEDGLVEAERRRSKAS